MQMVQYNGDFMTQVRNITADFIHKNKRPTTDLLAGNNAFPSDSLECKYAIY